MRLPPPCHTLLHTHTHTRTHTLLTLAYSTFAAEVFLHINHLNIHIYFHFQRVFLFVSCTTRCLCKADGLGMRQSGREGGIWVRELCMIYIFIVLHILALKKSLQGAKVLYAFRTDNRNEGSKAAAKG